MSVQSRLMDDLQRDFQLTPEQAAGFVGNLAYETANFKTLQEIDPVVEGSRGGGGYAQWTGPRRVAFENWANEQGLDAAEYDANYGFLKYELQNTPEGRVLDELRGAETADDAARIVSEKFLRPGIPNLDRRIQLARTFAGGDYQVAQNSAQNDALDLSPEQGQQLYGLYINGDFTDQEKADYEAAAKAGLVPLPQDNVFTSQEPEEDRSVWGELSRQLGLTGRAITEGAANTASIFTDPVAITMNLALPDEYEISSIREPVSNALDAVGIPRPETRLERGVQAVGRGMTGAALTMGAGSLAGPFSRQLTASPALQTVSGGAAEGAGQTAAELGAGPVGQMVAAIIAGGTTSAPLAQKSGTTPRPAPNPAEIGATIRKAAGTGPGSAAAKKKLAEMVRQNPEAAAAAERLGIDLPADVFSDSVLIKEGAGLPRSIQGSEASAAFREQIIDAVNKADEAISAIGGTRDLSTVSDTVYASLTESRDALKSQAKLHYKGVDESIPREAPISTPSLSDLLNKTVLEVGESGLTSAEKRLLEASKMEGGITYARLLREKSLVGKAVGGMDSPYSSMADADLKRLYGAISEDQISAVGELGGKELSERLTLANQLTAKQKELERTIISAFGKDMNGSIAQKLKTAATQASRGDLTGLNKILSVMPKDLQKEAVASAIAAATKSARATEPGFGFAEYSKFYAGLRENSAAYSRVVDVLGPNAHRLMNDLYIVSKRVTEARANVLTTGKANQALVQGMTAEGVIQAVLKTTAGKMALSGAGSLTAGPTGAMAAPVVAQALTSGRKDVLKSVGELFRSNEFKKMVTQAATSGESNRAVNQLARSPKFIKWYAQATGNRNPQDAREWLITALSAARTMGSEEE